MGKLVDVKGYIPEVVIDLKYATQNNFMGEIVYGFNKCLLLGEVAICLKEVSFELAQKGLRLKIWDGFRPMFAQKKLWETKPDPRYVSDPKTGGRHTRGTAVDVTLVGQDDQELIMPTGFDDFSPKAHADAKTESREAHQNRKILQDVMCKHGFTIYPFEWWHFDYALWEKYPQISSEEYETLLI